MLLAVIHKVRLLEMIVEIGAKPLHLRFRFLDHRDQVLVLCFQLRASQFNVCETYRLLLEMSKGHLR
ncbi:hypothetical protein WM15_24410 [Burkholderia ubonensis]|nr:hypothetical protein WM15_24410 [Burkholderia ubonensis]